MQAAQVEVRSLKDIVRESIAANQSTYWYVEMQEAVTQHQSQIHAQVLEKIQEWARVRGLAVRRGIEVPAFPLTA